MSAAPGSCRHALLLLQRAEPCLRGVELHLLASGDLKIASGRGVPSGLLAHFSGLPWTPADARLEPADIPAWLGALQCLRRWNLSPATLAALDRLAA